MVDCGRLRHRALLNFFFGNSLFGRLLEGYDLCTDGVYVYAHVVVPALDERLEYDISVPIELVMRAAVEAGRFTIPKLHSLGYILRGVSHCCSSELCARFNTAFML
ncbi:hypothetical protein MLD38_016623 [Melastoma candidum]|uniref:Uncharacterized protein n=1 Tax=Melastoma candidum TaxID=119954 RepID=A0ACB9QMW5_9MYRT|nr:hypothetical protein MLD38_016623 [Melastoma candidum]